MHIFTEEYPSTPIPLFLCYTDDIDMRTPKAALMYDLESYLDLSSQNRCLYTKILYPTYMYKNLPSAFDDKQKYILNNDFENRLKLHPLFN